MFKVIWKYNEEQMGALTVEVMPEPPLNTSQASGLFEGLPMLSEPEPVFTDHPLDLRSSVLAIPTFPSVEERLDLTAYYQVFVSSLEEAEELKLRLDDQSNIETVQIQGRPLPPFYLDEERKLFGSQFTAERMLLPAAINNFESHQGYLDAAPIGIDARYAWGIAGGRGRGVTVIDIESGWNFQHEDLSKNLIGLISGHNSPSYSDHGTAVLGVFGADLNGIGITGIAPGARAGAMSATYDWHIEKWNAANTIYQAVKHLSRGDIILLEMHAPGPNATGAGQQGFVPIEYWDAEFDAIKYASAKGIYIVECAGNGGENLDDAIYQNRFDVQSRDSGAILVGAGASGYQNDARSRLHFSNFGSRLDVQGWGENIVSCGGRGSQNYYDLRDHPEPSKCYTRSFGGTSGAGPIVAGAIASISGCLLAAKMDPLPPNNMRSLLNITGSRQTDSVTSTYMQENIGPLPDIQQALVSLGI